MFTAICRTRRLYQALCIHAVTRAYRHANLLLFVLGVVLLSAGMNAISQAQVKLAEKTANKGTEPYLSNRAADGAFARPAPIAIGRPAFPAIGRLAPGAQGRLAPGALGRLAENNQAGLRAAEAGLSRPAEAALNLPPQNTDIPYDDTLIRNSVGNLFKFMEGAFGALIVVGSGIGAIIAATMGAYKAAVALLVVSVGAFILRAYVSLFFGTDYQDYEVGQL